MSEDNQRQSATRRRRKRHTAAWIAGIFGVIAAIATPVATRILRIGQEQSQPYVIFDNAGGAGYPAAASSDTPLLHSFNLSPGKSPYEQTSGVWCGPREREPRPVRSFHLSKGKSPWKKKQKDPVFNFVVENCSSQRDLLIYEIVYHILDYDGPLGRYGEFSELLEPTVTYVHGIQDFPGYYDRTPDGSRWVYMDNEGNDLPRAPVRFAPLQPQIVVPSGRFVSFNLQLFSESEARTAWYLMRIELVTSLGSLETEEFELQIARHETTPPDSWQRAQIRAQ